MTELYGQPSDPFYKTGRATIKALPPALRVERERPAQLTTADQASASLWSSMWVGLGDAWSNLTIPGFAGDRVNVTGQLVDPADRANLTPANAYALADQRFRELNSRGNLRAGDFGAIHDAYRDAAGVDPIKTIDTATNYGDAFAMFKSEAAQEYAPYVDAVKPWASGAALGVTFALAAIVAIKFL